MEPLGKIQPDVAAMTASIDDNRVQQRSVLDYPRHFWSALKNGHYRGALTGVAIAAPLSALIGAAVCAIPGVGWALAPAIIPSFIAAGSLMGAEGFGAVGAAAASRASGLAEKHARIMDPANQGDPLKALDDKLMYDGQGHHYEFPSDRDKGKFWYWKSGLTGAAMGAASGGVIGLTAGALHIPALAAVVKTLAVAAPVLSTVAMPVALAAIGITAGALIAGAVTFGAFGLTFGLERKVLKTMLNQTDATLRGDLVYKDGPDLGRAQLQGNDQELVARRVQRQETIGHLEKAYNERIFWGALNGRFRGFGGAVPGVVVGAAVGAIVATGIALATAGAALLPLAATLIPLFAGGGGFLGMKIMSESGTEAGAESAARAIDEEFERNRVLKAKGITPPAPEQPKGNWIIPKAVITAGLLGAAVGVALATTIGPAILGIFMTKAALAGVAAFSAKTVAVSSLTCGMVGASYGLGNKTLKIPAKISNFIYDKVYFRPADPTQQTSVAPQPNVQPSQPPVHEKVTAEDVARMNERQQQRPSPGFEQAIAPSRMQSATVGIS